MRLAGSAARSDPGRKRLRNEDSFVCEPPLFAVADGMGGAQAGELASGLAAAALREHVPGATTEERLASLIREANRRVFARASADASASGMGTTMTVAVVDGERVVLGHVGDSRAYLLRDRTLRQVTHDHSLVAELVRSGRISPEEAETHPQRSVITRALGTDEDVDVDTVVVDAEPGDLYLLCSDGLTSMVDDTTILELAERHRPDLDATARELLAAANRGGGEDNITVVLFELEREGDTQRLPPPAPADEEPVQDDEADTLSGAERIPAVDTMVLGRDELRALAGREEAADADAADEHEFPARSPEAASAETASEPEETVPVAAAEREEPTAGPFHKFVALLVIVGLVVLIVVLVMWGLAR